MIVGRNAVLTGRSSRLGHCTGTANKIAKWTDNAGTLGDSVMNEVGAHRYRHYNPLLRSMSPGVQTREQSSTLKQLPRRPGNKAYTGFFVIREALIVLLRGRLTMVNGARGWPRRGGTLSYAQGH